MESLDAAAGVCELVARMSGEGGRSKVDGTGMMVKCFSASIRASFKSRTQPHARTHVIYVLRRRHRLVLLLLGCWYDNRVFIFPRSTIELPVDQRDQERV